MIKSLSKRNKIFEVLNVGSGERFSVPDFISIIEKILKKKFI